MTDATEAAFGAALPADGSLPDAFLLLVYANFLEERGRPGDARRAWVLRWCAATGAWPELYEGPTQWCWWRSMPPDHANLTGRTGLPRGALNDLPSGLLYDHPSFAAALLALGDILGRLGVLPAPLRAAGEGV